MSLHLVLLPALVVAFSLILIGEREKGDAVMDWAFETMFFERAPWIWLRPGTRT